MALPTRNKTNPSEQMRFQLRREGADNSTLEALTRLANHKAEYLECTVYDPPLSIGPVVERYSLEGCL